MITVQPPPSFLHILPPLPTLHFLNGPSFPTLGLAMPSYCPAKANYHIITYTSGLGRTAAFASLRANNVYTINMAGRSPGARSARTGSAGCLLVDHDRLRSVYDVWSGI